MLDLFDNGYAALGAANLWAHFVVLSAKPPKLHVVAAKLWLTLPGVGGWRQQ